jgi:hypothetical protein
MGACDAAETRLVESFLVPASRGAALYKAEIMALRSMAKVFFFDC